jgi:hypothetical protein
MNTAEIEEFLKTSEGFQGVFSSDRLPEEPKLLVCNTDPHHRPGEHWICINVDVQGRGEYFDSLGQPPSETFKHYLNEHCRSWTFNKRQLQSILSRFCGHYCCFYCVFRSRGVVMNRIVNQFSRDTCFNDVLVHSFVCNKR